MKTLSTALLATVAFGFLATGCGKTLVKIDVSSDNAMNNVRLQLVAGPSAGLDAGGQVGSTVEKDFANVSFGPQQVFKAGLYLPDGISGDLTIAGRAFAGSCEVAFDTAVAHGVKTGDASPTPVALILFAHSPICSNNVDGGGGPDAGGSGGSTGKGGSGGGTPGVGGTSGGSGGRGGGGGGAPGSGGGGGTSGSGGVPGTGTGGLIGGTGGAPGTGGLIGGTGGQGGGSGGVRIGTGGVGSGGVTATGGVTGGQCGDPPCGGNVVGTWDIQGSCASVVIPIGACPGELAHVDGISQTGILVFNADGSYSSDLSTSGNIIYDEPFSCQQGFVNCDDLGAAYQASVQQGGTPYSSAACLDDGTGSGCFCGFDYVPTTSSEDGTYATAGNTITLTPKGSTASSNAYCVSGSTLRLIRPDSTPGYPDDLFLTKR